jgi:hypothetical protein
LFFWKYGDSTCTINSSLLLLDAVAGWLISAFVHYLLRVAFGSFGILG